MAQRFRAALIPIGRKTFDVTAAEAVVRDAVQLLAPSGEPGTAAGGVAWSLEDNIVFDAPGAQAVNARLRDEGVDAALVLCSTFSDASLAVHALDGLDVPVILWSVPEPPGEAGSRLRLNSLCGANIAANALVRLGVTVRWVHGEPGEKTRRAIDGWMRVFRAACRVRGLKIGVVGQAPAGFYSSEADSLELKGSLGVELVRVPLDHVFAAASRVETGRVAAVVGRDVAGLANVSAVAEGEVEQSVRAQLALEDWARAAGLGAVAVECWPAFMTEFGGAVCWAMSRLIDGGVMAACEADVLGAVTMVIQRELTGGAPFFADLVEIDPDGDTAVFWHCGAAPLSLVSPVNPPAASVQPNRRVGLTLDFGLKGGPITVAKLGRGPRGGYRLLVFEGEAVDAPTRYRGNTLTARLHGPVEPLMRQAVEGGFDHHYSVAYGSVAAELKEVARLLGVDVVSVP